MRYAIVAVIVVAFVCFGSPTFAVAQDNESSSTPRTLRIVQLLEDTGLNYEKRSPTSRMARFKGSAGDDILVFVAPASGGRELVSEWPDVEGALDELATGSSPLRLLFSKHRKR